MEKANTGIIWSILRYDYLTELLIDYGKMIYLTLKTAQNDALWGPEVI